MVSPIEKNNQKETTLSTKDTSKSGFGAHFKTVREGNKLTLEDVAAELNILHRHLDAIEKSDFENLPQIAFTRGFVVSYAKFLKIDVNNVLAEFDSVYPQDKKIAQTEKMIPVHDNQAIGKINRDVSSNNKSGFNRTGGILVLLALLGLIIVYVITSSKDLEPSKTESEPTALEVMQEEQEALNTSSDNIDDVDNTTDVQANADTNQQTTPVNSNAQPLELDFWVKSKTDINITDQTGTVIMSGTKSRGSYVIKGQPPFQVQISKVSNVKLNMNRVPIKLAKYSVDNKADFTLTN